MTGGPENGTRALELLQDHPHVKEAKAEGGHLTIGFIGSHDELPQILNLLVQNGLPVASFGQREADLEDVFMKVTKGMVQ
jgi:ABC-2 type transport system ATP-binding protein